MFQVLTFYHFAKIIPCRHQLLLRAKTEIESAKDKLNLDDTSVKINEFVQLILKSAHFHKRVSFENADKIIKNIYLNGCEKINLNREDFLNLFTSIRSCFKFVAPEVPNIDLNWNTHNFEESTSKVILEFKKRERFNGPVKIELSNENKNTLIEEGQREAKNKAKTTPFQTIYEIMLVYPKTQNSSVAYSICFDEYLKYISFLEDEDIYIWLPKFKIARWKVADLKMGDNKFFK